MDLEGGSRKDEEEETSSCRAGAMGPGKNPVVVLVEVPAVEVMVGMSPPSL
eukprot:CAMPEP_0171771456 /NCGR_PEP_ID=MMETSP0991-20121206/54082_1 /TAXON_ID=483369 /ORGANISM="non described non described, Strain CCMP2098" /LENGTH=50 /DNA_ID=CAMNT_0012376753 /DNA_START=15 /DNA_END=167 /DNA_ORIENTATION=-